jgi:hypothetical protein
LGKRIEGLRGRRKRKKRKEGGKVKDKRVWEGENSDF